MASGRAVHLHSMPTGEGGTLHRRWLTRTSNQNQTKKCYCPQVGDSVVYVPKAHSYVLEKFGEGDGTISKPWESWPTNTSWPAVRCTVTQAIYRFPYRTCYYPDLGDDRFLDVTATYTLAITGVPTVEEREYPWPSPSFADYPSDHTFEVTVFECCEEDFIVPLHLYVWRLEELESAIQANKGRVDGIPVVVRLAANPDENGNWGDDADCEDYIGNLVHIDKGVHHGPHFKGCGYHALVMECTESDSEGEEINGVIAACCAWNITMSNPSVPAPTLPVMTNDVRERIENVLDTIIRSNTEIEQHFVEPVNLNEFEDYEDIIEVPMSLSFIRERLTQNYYTNKLSVISDMEVVRNNCHKYNEDDAELCDLASRMYNDFKSRLNVYDI